MEKRTYENERMVTNKHATKITQPLFTFTAVEQIKRSLVFTSSINFSPSL